MFKCNNLIYIYINNICETHKDVELEDDIYTILFVFGGFIKQIVLLVAWKSTYLVEWSDYNCTTVQLFNCTTVQLYNCTTVQLYSSQWII